MLPWPLSLLVSQMRKENEMMEKEGNIVVSSFACLSLSLLACSCSLRISWADIRDRRSIVGEVEQAGMVGGRVETTGGRDQFSGHFHAQQHFASGFAVVAGGLKNVRDGLGDSAVLQEAQDGLPIGRADGTGAHASELVVVALAQRVDCVHAGVRGREVVGQ